MLIAVALHHRILTTCASQSPISLFVSLRMADIEALGLVGHARTHWLVVDDLQSGIFLDSAAMDDGRPASRLVCVCADNCFATNYNPT